MSVVLVAEWEGNEGFGVLCVVGLLHCPSSKGETERHVGEFVAAVKDKCPGAMTYRCFAMESSGPLGVEAEAGGNVLPVPVCDAEKESFYFKTLMDELTYLLLRRFEGVFAKKVEAPFLVTPLDAEARERDIKAMQLGRLSKQKGDYSLLAGSPEDALIFYKEAKELCRSKSDWIWLAGALQGYCSALLLLEREEADALANLTEALLHFNKGKALGLEIEAHLNLARWKRVKAEYLEAATVLMAAASLTSKLATNKETVLVLSAVACEFKAMGYYRKYAFFLREIAGIYERMETMEGVREQVLLQAAPFFQLHELRTQEELIAPRWGACPVSERNGWVHIGALTLLQLAKLATNLQDDVKYATYVTQAIRLFPRSTSASTQAALAMLLQRNTQQLAPTLRLDMTGLPLVASINVIPAPNVVRLPPKVSNGGGGAGGKSVFIIAPKTREAPTPGAPKFEQPLWVRGEIATVRVTVVNDHDFPLQLERMRLCTDRGDAIEAYSASLSVPSKTTKLFDISVLPLRTGPVLVTGMEIQTFHVVAFHQVDVFGRSVANLDEADVNAVDGPLRVQVIEPLPQMHIDSVLFNGNHLSLIEGIQSSVVIAMENTGASPVRWVRLQVVENASARLGIYADRRCVFSWCAGESPRDLLAPTSPALMPGQSMQVNVDIYGLMGAIGASFTIEYGGGDEEGEYCRREVHHIPIFVRTALEVTRFDVHLCRFGADEIPAPFRMREAGTAQLRDAGPLCLLVFHVSNAAKNAFSLTASIDYGAGFVALDAPSMICAPGSTHVFGIPMPRTWLPEEALEDVPQTGQQYLRPRDALTTEQANALKLQYNYKRHLQRSVRLAWTSTNNQTGLLSLSSLNVTLPLVRKILPAPLLLAFGELPGHQVRQLSWSTYEATVAVGAMVEIAIAVTNNTSAVLRDRVFALALEDAEAIQGDLVMWNGSLHSMRPLLEPAASFQQHFQVCFLGAGSYKLTIECKNDDDLNAYCVSPTLIVKAVK